MKRVNNKQVPELWTAGIPARSANFSTDGKTLFSYNMPIGKTVKLENGMSRKVFCQYDAKSDNFVSATTSQHVGLTLRHIDKFSHWNWINRKSFEKNHVVTKDSEWFESLNQ